jgi:hypothetical protein
VYPCAPLVLRAICCYSAFEGKGLTVKDMKESLGSKGGAALLLKCFDTTLVVISVHLAKEWHKASRAFFPMLQQGVHFD